MFKLDLENAEEPEIKLPTSTGSLKKKGVPEKYLFLFYWLCQSLWLWNHNKLWKILQEMGIPFHLTCLLRNVYAGQEVTERTIHGTTDWFQIGKTSILSLCLFNFYAVYIMAKARLNEVQAKIKIAGRNINNCRYADDTMLVAEREGELKNLLMQMKEEREKAGLKLNIRKMKIMASSPNTPWQTGKQWKKWKTFFSWAPKSLYRVTAAMKLEDACFLEEKLQPT